MRIKKVSETTPIQAQVVDSLDGNSTTDAPSVRAVNTLNTYSTSETKIGTWVNGKPLYRKVVYINSLPNTQIGNYNAGISNIEQIVKCYGATTNGLLMNTVRPNNISNGVGCWYDINENVIKIETGTDRRSLSGYVTLEYTKTTD